MFYVVSGDSEGYIKVWDIEAFCLDEEQLNELTSDQGYEKRRRLKYSKFILVEDDMGKVNRRLSRRLRSANLRHYLIELLDWY